MERLKIEVSYRINPMAIAYLIHDYLKVLKSFEYDYANLYYAVVEKVNSYPSSYISRSGYLFCHISQTDGKALRRAKPKKCFFSDRKQIFCLYSTITLKPKSMDTTLAKKIHR